MNALLSQMGIDRLSVEQRLRLLQEIWLSLEADSDSGQFPLTEPQKEELARRLESLDANPDSVVAWEIVEAHARARLRR